MKFIQTIKQEVDVTHLLAEMEVRYWEDASVNGVDEINEQPTIPGVDGNVWKIKINLETGKIEDWPDGTYAKVHYKVCDAGTYKLLDVDGKVIAYKDGYVIYMMCPGDSGYGDYVIMNIGPDGVIENFTADFEDFGDDS